MPEAIDNIGKQSEFGPQTLVVSDRPERLYAEDGRLVFTVNRGLFSYDEAMSLLHTIKDAFNAHTGLEAIREALRGANARINILERDVMDLRELYEANHG